MAESELVNSLLVASTANGMATVRGNREGNGCLPAVDLASTYSQASNSYATTKVLKATTTPAAATRNAIQAPAECIDGGLNNNGATSQREQGQQQLGQRRRSTLTETLLAKFVEGGKANRPLTCLLGAALCISILNTLLLSFVIKSIQLNDVGFINGKLAWDSQLAATVLGLPTKLPSKSISLQSIESIGDDKPLRIEKKLSRSFGDPTATGKTSPSSSNKGEQYIAQADDEFHRSRLFAIDENDTTEKGKNSGEFNYIATVNRNYERATRHDQLQQQRQLVSGDTVTSNSVVRDQEAGTLEIGAKSFALNLIGDRKQHKRPTGANNQTGDNNRWGPLESTLSSGEGSELARPLLEFNGERQLITLSREEQLRLSPKTSGSLAVDGELWSSSITGSLEENLDLQTRDGNLVCKSEGAMRLVSKSGNIHLAGFEGIRLDTSSDGSLSLHSERLLIPSGIRYFDSEPQPSAFGSEASETLSTQHSLRAYNLAAVGGLLMATT